MYRKIIVPAVAAAAVLGTGTAAMAATGNSAPTTQHRSVARTVLDDALHGEFVSRDSNGTFVTHDFARGTVTAISRMLIVVHTADGTEQRYAVTASTDVRLRSDGLGHRGNITDVHLGDRVLVTGVGSARAVARHILDVGPRDAKNSGGTNSSGTNSSGTNSSGTNSGGASSGGTNSAAPGAPRSS